MRKHRFALIPQTALKINSTRTRKEWLERVQGDRSMRSIAAEIGVGSGNLSTWLSHNTLTAEKIITISYELGIDPVQALADTGHLKPTREDENATTEEITARISRLAGILKDRVKHPDMPNAA